MRVSYNTATGNDAPAFLRSDRAAGLAEALDVADDLARLVADLSEPAE